MADCDFHTVFNEFAKNGCVSLLLETHPGRPPVGRAFQAYVFSEVSTEFRPAPSFSIPTVGDHQQRRTTLELAACSLMARFDFNYRDH